MQSLLDPIVFAMLGISAITDLRTGRILNTVTYPAILLGLLMAATGSSSGMASSLLGGAIGGGLLYIFFTVGWMGGGDVKLMTAVGTLKGFPFILNALFYSVFIGGIAAALVLIWRGQLGAAMGDLVQAGQRAATPRLAAGTIQPRGGTFPFGVAIALGTTAAVAIEWAR